MTDKLVLSEVMPVVESVVGLAVDCEDSPWRGSLLVEDIEKLEECVICPLDLVVDSDPTGFVVDPAASVAVVEVVLAFGPVLVLVASGAPVVVEAVFVLCRCLF